MNVGEKLIERWLHLNPLLKVLSRMYPTVNSLELYIRGKGLCF